MVILNEGIITKLRIKLLIRTHKDDDDMFLCSDVSSGEAPMFGKV